MSSELFSGAKGDGCIAKEPGTGPGLPGGAGCLDPFWSPTYCDGPPLAPPPLLSSRAGVYNDLGSGSNVDICVIKRGSVEYLRNHQYLQGKTYERAHPMVIKSGNARELGRGKGVRHGRLGPGGPLYGGARGGWVGDGESDFGEGCSGKGFGPARAGLTGVHWLENVLVSYGLLL